jgi:hypothetical protein
MDKFKSEIFKQCGCGGLFCKCCNDTYSGSRHHSARYSKKNYRRIARTRMKLELKKEISEE